MPWLPAPISQSTWGATCLKSISPSLRNGVVIGGITPVGRIFMANPRWFIGFAGYRPAFPAIFRPAGANLMNVGAAIQSWDCRGRLEEKSMAGHGRNEDNR